MNRPLAFVCASLISLSLVKATASAEPIDAVHFTLASKSDTGKIHADFRKDRDGDHHNNWSSALMPSELIGLEVSSFRAAGNRPIRFAIVREAGRIDCAGNGGGGAASGSCRVTENPAFAQLLASRGIGRPTQDQLFGLIALNAHRELIDAVAAAHYPRPSIDDVMAMAALGVDRDYINGLARSGYRPDSIDSLVQFKALGISPEWIAGFARIGYARVPGDGLVQFRALGVTPDFIAGFQQLGYRNLDVDQLVQLKALNITPSFVRAKVGQQAVMPPVDKLIEYKIFGRRR